MIAFIGIHAGDGTILVVGVKESANFNSFIVCGEVDRAGRFFWYLGGMTLLHHPELPKMNLHPFLPPNTGVTFGLVRVVWCAARRRRVIFFAYIGFDAVSTAAQEAKNPKRDMPIGILGSLVLCTILYILVALVLTALVNYKFLNIRIRLRSGSRRLG